MGEPRPNQMPNTVDLEGIRAPLGVILYLIRRDNLDIYDIPIAKITKEYLDYLNMMDEAHIELAGEFFVLAATLMRIKAQMLLRKETDTDDDPREGLVRSLLEYKKMVEAARSFGEMEEERRDVYTRPVPEIEKKLVSEEPTLDLSLYQLMKAFQDVMYHFEAAEVREIELEEFTIEEKIEAVEAALKKKDQVAFHELFDGVGSRMELIVTLMGLLELVKHAHIKVQQDSAFGTVYLYKGENFGKELGAIEDWEAQPDSPVEVTAPGESEGSEARPAETPPVITTTNESVTVEDHEPGQTENR